MVPSRLVEAAQNAATYVNQIRERIHRCPETRFEEDRTVRLILEEIEALRPGLTTYCLVSGPFQWEGGVWLDVLPEGGQSNASRILRADMDALPVQEQTGLPYASEVSGKMHACGHDIHVAMLLGALRALADGSVKATQHLRFVFQRAEENPVTPSGGDLLVRQGITDGVRDAYGLHIWAHGDPGVFLSRPGPMMANSGRFGGTFTVSGGHVAMPHLGVNAADVLVDIAAMLRVLPIQVLGPTEPCSMVPAALIAGEADKERSNVMPSTGTFMYSARNMLDREQLKAFRARVQCHIDDILNRYGDSLTDWWWVDGHPALTNTPERHAWSVDILQAAGEKVDELPLEMGGEDFAHYLREVPGCFWMLGANQPGCGGHHSPTFNPDPAVFWRGVHFWLLLATN